MKSKSKRAVLVIEEAAGKTVRQLSISEPYPDSPEIYLGLEFEDGTETLIEIGCVPCFRITQLVRDNRGELRPVRKKARKMLPVSRLKRFEGD